MNLSKFRRTFVSINVVLIMIIIPFLGGYTKSYYIPYMDYLHHFKHNFNKYMNSVLVSWTNTNPRKSSEVVETMKLLE